MTLRQKTLAIIATTLIGLIVLLVVIYQLTVLRSFEELERANAVVNVERVLSYLATQARSLSLQVKDWAYWDETYAYMQGDAPTFVEDNLEDSTFLNLRLNTMLFVDEDGQIVFGKAFDLATAQELPLSENYQVYLDQNPLLISRPTDPTQGVAGLLVVNETALLVATSPILRSDESGAPVGTLIWARFLDAPVVSQLSDFIHAPVDFGVIASSDLADDFVAANAMVSVTSPTTTQILDAGTLGAYGLLNDLFGQPTLLVRLRLDRDIYEHGQLTMSLLTLFLALVGVVFAILFLILLERFILARLARMSREVEGIGLNQDFSVRLDDSGSDELAMLARAINNSLQAAAHSQAKLQVLNDELEQHVARRTADLEREILFQEAILNSMHEGVLYGTEDAIEYANQMMGELSGYPVEELAGKPQSFLFPLPMRHERRRILGGEDDGLIEFGERKLRRQDGKLVDVAFTVAPLLGDATGPKQVAIVRDVTEEKALQARRDRFLANASHELRTPLTNLITRLYLLRRQPDMFETHLDVLDRVAIHMKALVEDLLDVSRFNKGTLSLKRERLKLGPLITDVVELQTPEAERKRLTLVTHLPETDVLVFVDRKRFNQVLTNLIFNAINYTPSGGRVEVQLTTETVNDTTFALICVADTGVGIEQENLDQIFQPFFRASQEVPGTGLGLTIVKEIVMRHGGEMTVESSVGEGTKFIVRIATLKPESDAAANS